MLDFFSRFFRWLRCMTGRCQERRAMMFEGEYFVCRKCHRHFDKDADYGR